MSTDLKNISITKELQTRPAIPTSEEIAEDLERCEKDDALFLLNINEEKDNNELNSKEASPAKMGHSSNEYESNPDIELVYQKALKFTELTEQLKTAPETLRNQTQYLEKLGEDLVQSIGKLKVQAQKVSEAKLTNN